MTDYRSQSFFTKPRAKCYFALLLTKNERFARKNQRANSQPHPQATSVQIWRTKDNKIQSFDVLASGMNVEAGGRRRQRGGGAEDGGNFGYNKLEEEEESPVVKSDFNSREDSHKLKDANKEIVINVGDSEQSVAAANGPNVIVVRRPRSPRNKVRVIEELRTYDLPPVLRQNNSRIYRVLDDLDSLGGSGNFRLLNLSQLSDRRDHGGGGSRVEIVKLGPSDHYLGPLGHQQFNYSRHYGNRENGLAHVIEVEPSLTERSFVDPYEQYLYRQRGRHRDHRGGGGGHRDRDGGQREEDDHDRDSERRRHKHGQSLSGEEDRRRHRSHRVQVKHGVFLTCIL